MRSVRYPQFAAAVRSLAPTAQEIAQILGVQERMIYYYVAGKIAPRPEVFLRFPALTAALTADCVAMPQLAESECKG